MPGTKREAVVKTLEFYKALGFERMPMALPDSQGGSTEEKAEALERLRLELGPCTRCGLSGGRKNIVFGEGNPGAELMFIGECPGRDEDAQGRPFVGEAGELLDRLIEKMGLKREEVYIGNIIKCHPPGNRDPGLDEIHTCLPFITAQAGIIMPKVIIALGRISAHTLLKNNTPISRLRGKFADFQGIPVMPTFHPAYLLKNRGEKIKVWEDAKKVLIRLGMEVPE